MGPLPVSPMPGAPPPGPAPGVLPPPGMPPFGGLQPPGAPPIEQFEAVTQQDGTVLLHLKNPDGSLGPAVRIVSVPKPKTTGIGGLPLPGAGTMPGR